MGIDGVQVISSYSGWLANLLMDLNLSNTGLDDEGFRIFLPALSGSKISGLTLNKNRLGFRADKSRVKENLSFAFSQSYLPSLLSLNLCDNGLGREGCESLSILLQREMSPLHYLSLCGDNNLDYECCFILSKALRNNKALEWLRLFDDYDVVSGITSTGWDHFLRLVCDDTSFASTINSNRTLIFLGPKDASVLPPLLQKMLEINDSRDWDVRAANRKSQKKILHAHFQGEFNIAPFLELDVKLIPHLLQWISQPFRFHGIGKAYMFNLGFQAFHRIIRNWNVAALFGFPTAECARINSHVQKLERDKIALQSRNALLESKNMLLESKVASLEDLVKKLQAENDLLKKEENAAHTEEYRKKRKRTSPEQTCDMVS